MNPWLRKPIQQNPYLRNAFQVARVARDVTGRKQLAQRIGITRRVISTDPQAHIIAGQAVSMAELIAAEQVLLDPQQRILEELFEHATETPPLEHLRRLAAALEDDLRATPPGAETGLRPDAFAAWMQALAAQVLAQSGPAEASLGALELAIAPPFGWIEEP